MKAQWFFALLLINYSLSAQVSDKQPTMYRGNAQLTGVYNTQAIKKLKGVAFEFKTEGPIRSTPAEAGGVVFIGSGDGIFYALDGRTGREKWRFKTGGAIHSSPAVDNGVVYFISRDENLYALQAATGKELWRFRMGKDLAYENGWDYYLSSPVIVGRNLYVGSGDGNLYAFDVTTKKVIWKFNTGSRIRTAPAVADNHVLVGTMDGHLISVRRDNGSLEWKFASDGTKLKFAPANYDRTAILSSPSVGNGIAVFGARDGFLYAVDLATGKEKWRFTHNGSWVLGTAILDGTVFAGSGSSAFVQAVDSETGVEKWRFKTAASIFSSLTIAGDVMYFDDYFGNLYAVETNSGKEIWRFPMGRRSLSSALVSNGMVYCSSDDGILFGLEGDPNGARIAGVKSNKAVYWDAVKGFNWFSNGSDIFIRDYFKNSGYEVVDAGQLENFITARLKEKTSSVIVLALNKIPNNLLVGEKASLFRKYLDAGGKVVMLGPDALAYIYNDATNSLDSIDFSVRPAAITGIHYRAKGIINHGSAYGSTVTEEGKRWGLRGWWPGYSSVTDEEVTTVLARDEYGQASCWVKNFGGPEGTGLVQLYVPKESVGADLFPIRAAVEYGVEW